MDDQATFSQTTRLLAQVDTEAQLPPDQGGEGEGAAGWETSGTDPVESGAAVETGSTPGYGDSAATADEGATTPSDSAAGSTVDAAQTPPPPGLDGSGGTGGQPEAPPPTAGMYEDGSVDPGSNQGDPMPTGAEGAPQGAYGAFEENVGPVQTPPLGLLPVIGVALIGLAALIIFFARRRKNWNDIGDDLPDDGGGSEKSRHTTGHSAITTQFSGAKTLGETSLSHHSSQHVSSFD